MGQSWILVCLQLARKEMIASLAYNNPMEG